MEGVDADDNIIPIDGAEYWRVAHKHESGKVDRPGNVERRLLDSCSSKRFLRSQHGTLAKKGAACCFPL